MRTHKSPSDPFRKLLRTHTIDQEAPHTTPHQLNSTNSKPPNLQNQTSNQHDPTTLQESLTKQKKKKKKKKMQNLFYLFLTFFLVSMSCSREKRKEKKRKKQNKTKQYLKCGKITLTDQ